MKRSHWILVCLAIAFFVFVSVSQTLLYVLSSPQGFTFFLVHNFPADYYYYLQLIRQGMEGHIGATTWMTPSVYPLRLVNTTFLFLGYLARLLPIGGGFAPMYWYFIARITGACAILGLIAILLFSLKDKMGKRIFSMPSLFFVFVFTFFSSSWWTYTEGVIILPSILSKWTELDPIFRWSYIPSHLWSKVFFLVTYLLLMRTIFLSPASTIVTRILRWGSLALSVIIMGFSSPITILTFGLSVGLTSLVLLIQYITSRRRQDLELLIAFAIALFFGLGVLLYHRMLISDVFPWNTYALWNTKTLPLPIWEYAMSFGPALPLFIFSIPFLWSLGTTGILLVTWGLSGFIGVYGIAPFLHVYPILFLEGYQFIPMSVGAGWILLVFGKRIASRSGIVGMGYIPIGISIIYVLISTIGSFQTHLGYIKQNQTNTDVVSPVGYIAIMQYLSNHAPRESVVIAPPSLSLMLPAFSAVRALGGHILMTDDNDTKMADIATFYRGGAIEKKTIFDRYRASYVVMTDGHVLTVDEERYLGVMRIMTDAGYTLYGRK